MYAIRSYYDGPFGDITDTVACEDQFRNAFLMGCVGAWSLHPVQIDIARKVLSPPGDEVLWAKKVVITSYSIHYTKLYEPCICCRRPPPTGSRRC